MILKFPNKRIRADVICQYIEKSRYRGCVCFSTGNASACLKATGLFVVDVSPNDLSPTRWWTPEEIHRAWPDLFDATSGHLPAFLMVRIGQRFKAYLGDLEGSHEVPTGSGETIQCLRWAYPEVRFVPVFNCGPGTEYNENSPLVKAVSEYEKNYSGCIRSV